MYYIYIIYSASSDVYYIGYSDDPQRRLFEHNTKLFNTYTSKHRPWVLTASFKCSANEAEATQIERFIKKQHSRKFIKKIIEPDFVPNGVLAQLIRVPDIRD